MVFRVARIIGGAALAYLNLQGAGAGTMLGLYVPNSAERFGYDLAKLAFYLLGAWLIFRGFKPAHARQLPLA